MCGYSIKNLVGHLKLAIRQLQLEQLAKQEPAVDEGEL